MTSVGWSEPESQQLSPCRSPHPPAAAPSTPVLRDQPSQGSGLSPACHLKVLDYSVVTAQADPSFRLSRRCKKDPWGWRCMCPAQGFGSKSRSSSEAKSQGPQGPQPGGRGPRAQGGCGKRGLRVAAKMKTSG